MRIGIVPWLTWLSANGVAGLCAGVLVGAISLIAQPQEFANIHLLGLLLAGLVFSVAQAMVWHIRPSERARWVAVSAVGWGVVWLVLLALPDVIDAASRAPAGQTISTPPVVAIEILSAPIAFLAVGLLQRRILRTWGLRTTANSWVNANVLCGLAVTPIGFLMFVMVMASGSDGIVVVLTSALMLSAGLLYGLLTGRAAISNPSRAATH